MIHSTRSSERTGHLSTVFHFHFFEFYFALASGFEVFSAFWFSSECQSASDSPKYRSQQLSLLPIFYSIIKILWETVVDFRDTAVPPTSIASEQKRFFIFVVFSISEARRPVLLYFSTHPGARSLFVVILESVRQRFRAAYVHQVPSTARARSEFYPFPLVQEKYKKTCCDDYAISLLQLDSSISRNRLRTGLQSSN